MLQHLITEDEDLRMVPIDPNQLANAVAGTRAELRAIPEGTDDAEARVLARWTGIGLMALGDHDDALVFLQQALDLATASGNTRAVIATELNLGDAYRYAGEAETAEMLYRRALEGARGQHPELVDFDLQHLGKHLMEQVHVAEFGFGEANLLLPQPRAPRRTPHGELHRLHRRRPLPSNAILHREAASRSTERSRRTAGRPLAPERASSSSASASAHAIRLRVWSPTPPPAPL
ncbi:tetratricopeptide repeat protein [Streptomyces sp. MJM1172]|uniref:tetratricopeptide repeat protein n=1 Tax=Streptomyces sp. MJM1172 TaxID=1703926 RepID=UPI0009A1E389